MKIILARTLAIFGLISLMQKVSAISRIGSTLQVSTLSLDV